MEEKNQYADAEHVNGIPMKVLSGADQQRRAKIPVSPYSLMRATIGNSIRQSEPSNHCYLKIGYPSDVHI